MQKLFGYIDWVKEKFGQVLHGFFLDTKQEVSENKIIINKR